MDVFIPLHAACRALQSQEKFIPVLSEVPKMRDETYFVLDMSDPSIYGFELGNGGGKALPLPTLHHAKRINSDEIPQTDMESSIARGIEIASSLHFGSAMEYLAAWVNEDRKQATLCMDLHAILSLNIIEKTPKWISQDLFSLLESEAMKQVFATRYFIEAKRENSKTPSLLKTALQESAENKTNEMISTLIANVMQKQPIYKGEAGKFTSDAMQRLEKFIQIA